MDSPRILRQQNCYANKDTTTIYSVSITAPYILLGKKPTAYIFRTEESEVGKVAVYVGESKERLKCHRIRIGKLTQLYLEDGVCVLLRSVDYSLTGMQAAMLQQTTVWTLKAVRNFRY